MTLQGSCLCRTVAYEADSLGGPIVHCHCATCRKAHAAAYASTVRVERPHFRIVRGQDKLTAHESSPGKFRHFCSVCGSHVVAERPAQTHILVERGARYSGVSRDADVSRPSPPNLRSGAGRKT